MDLKRLRELATRATTGPWESYGYQVRGPVKATTALKMLISELYRAVYE